MSETAERAPEEVAALPPTPGLGGGPWGAVKRTGAVLAQQREATVLVVAVLLVIYFWRASDAFLTKDNIVNLSQITAPIAIIAIGEVFLLVCGEIDLSVGFIMTFSPFLMHYLIDFYSVPATLAILIALLFGLFAGFCNGFITVVLGVPSLRNGRRGDLVAEVNVEVPTRLSQEEAELLAQFAAMRGEHVTPPHEGLFSRIRSAFKS